MNIIPNGKVNALEIERSKFLTYFYHVKSLDDAKQFQQSIRKEHPNANHHCLAVVVDDLHYASDDGEPHGTAGQPMLQTLLGNQINEVACIVVRYFGGTLLGRGGLIRAYGQSVSEGLKIQDFYQYQEVQLYKITIPYNLMSIMETKLEPKAKIIERYYDEQMIFEIEVIDSTIIDDLIELTNNNIQFELIKTEQRLIPKHDD